MWSCPSHESVPSMSARSFFFQAPLQSNVVSIVEKKCSEAREAGSAHSMAGYTLPRKRWEALIWYSCLLRENLRFSTVLRRLGRINSFPAFCRKPQVSSAEFTSPILLTTVCSHSSAVPFSNKLFSKTSSAKSVTPQERSSSSHGLRPKMPMKMMEKEVKV